jgi:hypothetical protein
MTNGEKPELSPLTLAVYELLRLHIDNVDAETVSDSELSSLLDLKKSVDAIVEKGLDRWRAGKMS